MMRHLIFAGLLATCIGIPYFATRGREAVDSVGSWFGSSNKSSQNAAELEGGISGTGDLVGTPDSPGGSGLGAAPIAVDEVFRFDISPDWIVTRWPRVSTGVSQEDLQTYRVLLVTGLSEHDLAGSLTYHFDKQGHLRKITFTGTTGNPREVIKLVTSRFKFVRQDSGSPDSYRYARSHSGKDGLLQIRTSPLLQANDPLRRFRVKLVLTAQEGLLRRLNLPFGWSAGVR